ncbi:cytochrome c [bacterium]|nr:cytochrome c [bacterium]
MQVQPKIDEPYQQSPTFGDSYREFDPEAVPVGWERADEAYYLGTDDGDFVTELPENVTVDAELLARGQREYIEFCSPCHGYGGYGDGVISLEGYPAPGNFHTDRLRAVPVGYLYDVILNGVGNMYNYAARVPVENRWAIVAYIRTLQLSQFTDAETLPADIRDNLTETTSADASMAEGEEG